MLFIRLFIVRMFSCSVVRNSNVRLFDYSSVRNSIIRLFVCSAVLLSACAPVKWAAVVEKDAELVWPPPPSPVRVEYVGEMHAFTPTGESFFTKIFGRSNSAGAIEKPVAIALGGDGRIAIADAALSGVHLFIPQESKYLFLNGSDYAKFLSPVSVVFNEEMQLFVSDSEGQLLYLFDQQGILIKTIASAGNINFQRPTGLTIQPKDNLLYVVDTTAHRVLVFDDKGRYLKSFGDRGIEEREFNFPTHIASDYNGRVYVNDAMNFRVQIFDPEGDFISQFGQHGNGTGDFAMSKGIAVDKESTIYVVDTLFDRIQLFDMKGRYLMDVGSKGTKAGEFWLPSGIFFDYHTSRLYVCDTYNKRIQIFQVMKAGEGDG